MKKTLLITLDYPPGYGGVGRMYQSFCRLVDKDNIIVIAPPISLINNKDGQEQFKIVRQELLSKKVWPHWITTIIKLYKISKTLNSNQLIVGQVLPIGTAVYFLAFFYKINYAVFVHGMDVAEPINNFIKRFLIRHILLNSSGVLAANDYVAELVQELGINNSKIYRVYPIPILKQPNNISSLSIKKEFKINEAPMLLTIARLVSRKGIDVVLKSLNEVWTKFPNLHYFIIGDGPKKENLYELSSQLNRPKQVHFMGALNDENTAKLLLASDIFIMTPKTTSKGDIEGLGMVYLEASKFGKPVIGAKHGGISGAIKNDETGILVEENNHKATSRAIIQLLSSPELRKTYGENGQRFVDDKFNGSNYQDTLDKVFDNH